MKYELNKYKDEKESHTAMDTNMNQPNELNLSPPNFTFCGLDQPNSLIFTTVPTHDMRSEIKIGRRSLAKLHFLQVLKNIHIIKERPNFNIWRKNLSMLIYGDREIQIVPLNQAK